MLQVFHKVREAGAGGPDGAARVGEQQGEQARFFFYFFNTF
jgi:hypothetical protein